MGKTNFVFIAYYLFAFGIYAGTAYCVFVLKAHWLWFFLAIIITEGNKPTRTITTTKTETKNGE